MIDYKSYPKVLADKDEYVTDRSVVKTNWLTRLLFYPRLAQVVYESNRKAKKNIYNRYNWVDASLKTIDAMEKAGLNYHITGMDNLKKFDGPAVFIGNHMSTLETLALPSIIQPVKPVCFVIKKELADYPLFGAVVSARHPIIVGRANPREDLKLVLEEGSDRLKNGRSVIIFPQKTRSKFFDIKSFNSLGVKLAQRNNVYVLPFALLTDAWPNGKVIKEVGKLDPSKKVRFAFGEPFKPESNSSQENQKVIDFIKSKLIEWGREEYIKD